MAKETSQRSQHVSNMIKTGKPRRSKRYRTKGSFSRTSKKGNGKRLR